MLLDGNIKHIELHRAFIPTHSHLAQLAKVMTPAQVSSDSLQEKDM